MDVVLINSPIILYENEAEKERYKNVGGDETSYYPLNILYLAGYLEKLGHTCKVIDISAERKTLKDIEKEVDQADPKVIGISAMTPSIQSALILAKRLKNEKRVLVLGGVHLSCDISFLSRVPNSFDIGVSGEGEYTLEQIVRSYRRGRIPQISGKVFKGQPINDLDALPFPARHLINPAIYKRGEQLDYEIPAAGILASRGCPFNCIFCCIPARGKKVRFRSAKNIVDEMEAIYGQCKGSYSFIDDCFSVNKRRVSEFCQEVVKRKIKCSWIASTRADNFDEELGELFSHAGCKELYFGVESGNERIRNAVIGKRLSEDSIKSAVKICRKNKIISNLFLMLGFPTETKKEIEDTIKISSRVGADNIGIHITRPLPGSDIFKYAVDNKMIKADIYDDWASGRLGKDFRNACPMFIPPMLTLKDLVNAKKRAYRKHYLNLAWMFRRLVIWLTIKGKFRDDLKLFKLIWQVFMEGGTRGQLS